MTTAYRVDGQAVDATAFYAVACDPARSVVVEACAGAGKTWMLVSRILRALLAGVDPEQILAITFTRKAAGEMQARLDEWLRDFSDASSTPEQRVEALCLRGLDRAAAQRQADALGALRQRLLRRPRGVEVRTFHAWFAQLAGQLPLALRARLGLPADPVLVEDTSPLQPVLFQRFERRVHADPALRDDYECLVQGHRRSAVQNWLETAWRRGDELTLADRHGVLEHSMPDAAALDPRCVGLDDPARLLLDPTSQAAWQAAVKGLAARTGVKAQAAAAGLAKALDHARAGDPAVAFREAWIALFAKAGTPRKGLGDLPEVAIVVEALEQVHALRGQQQAHDDHLRMVRLSRVLLDEYAALKRARALVDMADLERAAGVLLSDPAHAGWVQQRLDLRIQQVLIDEFQDTSPLQWHALFGWLSAYAGAGGGASGQRPPGVFIVGDPKQSIYRFRRAEPRVFEAARDFVVHGLDGQVLACDHTRRNVPAVVEGLNAVFDDAARVDGWGPFRPHTTAAQGAGALWALPGVPRAAAAPAAPTLPRWRDSLTEPRHDAEAPRKALEARLVAASIADGVAHDGLQPGQVMVLARQRAMLHRVAAELAAHGLPCVMPEALSLADEPEAQDLVALLDVLASPGHDLSLARALKSPVFGLSDDELLALSQRARQSGSPWLDALVDDDPGDAAGGRSAAWLRARDLLRSGRGWIHDLSPHDLLDRLLHAGDVEARVLAATPPPRRMVVQQLMRGLLQAALEHEGGRFVSTYQFVRALKQGRLKAAPQVPPSAVRLLTVHGAKGLEADVVYLVDTWPERRNPARSALIVDWPVEAVAPRVAAFVSSEARMPPALAELMQREQLERDREEINGLYVAFTRARQRLVVSYTEPHAAGSARSWWQRLQPVLTASATPEPASAQAGGGAGIAPPWPPALVNVLPVSNAASIAPPTAPPAAAPTAAPQADDANAAALGRAVHRLLEWIGQPASPLPRARWADAAEQAATSFGLRSDSVADVLRLATTIADSPACARFFAGPDLRWAGNEVPVADGQGRTLRIDRLVQLGQGDDAVWWVLDYKLRHQPDALSAYREQLEQYRQWVMAAVRRSGEPDVAVWAGFITGAGQFVEQRS